MRIVRHILDIETEDGLGLFDLTPQIRDLVARSGVTEGLATVTSRHTTTAVTINENEARLIDDVRAFFGTLAPADGKYRHNDIALRDCPPDEPENAHSHLIAMMLGSSESIPVVAGALDLGTYQSVMLVDLDGPRKRAINIQVMGL